MSFITGCVTVALPLENLDNMFVHNLLIQLTEYGLKGHLEFPITEVFSDHNFQVNEPEEDKRRGVFGYVWWGYGAGPEQMLGITPEIFWLNGGFVNWKNSLHKPDRTHENPSHFRIWLRRGVRARWSLVKADPFRAPRNLIVD